jgi:uncharacterized membrane protein
MTTMDPSNPAPTPPAVPNLPPLPTALLAQPRGMPLGAGVQWISTGWEMFKAVPGPWVGILLVYVIVTGVVSLLPLLSIINVVLYPILAAGLVAACEAQRTGSAPAVEHLMVGFRKDAANLALVGVFYMIGVLLVVVVVGGGGLAAMLPFIVAAAVGGENFTMTPAMIGIIVVCVMLLFVLTMPLAFTMAWAPALVSVHQMKPFEAVKHSLRAAVRNWLTLLIFAFIAGVLMMVAIIPLGLGLLVWGPVMIIATWASYREVFVA